MLLFLLACPSEPEDSKPTTQDSDSATTQPDTTDPATVPLAGACEDINHWGNFTIDSNEDYAYVSGSVANGVVPMTILTRMTTVGDCTIWRRENPYCNPTCESGYTCDLSGSCIPYPESQDLGLVTATGLVQAVSMSPVTPGYTYFDTSLPNPPWTAGNLLTIKSEGGAYNPFTLHGVAPVDLQATTMDWTITPHSSFSLTWDALPEGARSTVLLHLSIDQHGVTPSSVACNFADDGAGEVPAEVIDALIDLGLTGFPAGDLSRRTTDHADVDAGCVDMVASSSRLARVTIQGYTPCTRDEDCPANQTCNETLERCEDM